MIMILTYYLRVGIMNIGSVDQISQEVEHWRAGNAQQLDLEYLVPQAGFFYHPKTNQNSRTTFWCCYKNFDALDKSSTQFDLGSFFLDGHHAK
jgi:hypothetical protein